MNLGTFVLLVFAYYLSRKFFDQLIDKLFDPLTDKIAEMIEELFGR